MPNEINRRTGLLEEDVSEERLIPAVLSCRRHECHFVEHSIEAFDLNFDGAADFALDHPLVRGFQLHAATLGKWSQSVSPGRRKDETAGSGVDQGIAQHLPSRLEGVSDVNLHDGSPHGPIMERLTEFSRAWLTECPLMRLRPPAGTAR